MKDYTLNNIDKEKFILNYDKNNNEIIINYASVKKYKTSYFKELEKYLLQQMKQQILQTNINDLKIKYRKKFIKNSITWMIISLLVITLSTPLILTFMLEYILYLIMVYIPKKELETKINDYKKNKLFIDNIELFQNGLTNELEPLYKISKKTTKELERLIELQNSQHKELFNDNILKEPTLNTIESISLSKLNEIYYLLLTNEFLLTYEKNINSKRKTLSKDNNNLKKVK